MRDDAEFGTIRFHGSAGFPGALRALADHVEESGILPLNVWLGRPDSKGECLVFAFLPAAAVPAVVRVEPGVPPLAAVAG